jgi:hypothetical protein
LRKLAETPECLEGDIPERLVRGEQGRTDEKAPAWRARAVTGEEVSALGGALGTRLAKRGAPVAARLEDLRAPVKRAVEFVDQKVDRLVGVFGSDACEQVGSADFDVTFGHENRASAGRVVLQIDTDPVDIPRVAEEAFGFSTESVAEGVGEGEVDSAKEDLRAGVRGTGVNHCTKLRPTVSGRVPYNEAGDLEAAYD